MYVIQPTCRAHMTDNDFQFVMSVLNKAGHARVALSVLLADEDARDLILDDPDLFAAIQERPDCLKISWHFYFYILVRYGLMASGLQDRRVADYVAEVLAEFSREERRRYPLPGSDLTADWFVDMMIEYGNRGPQEQFMIQTHMANHALFMSGLFRERIEAMQSRRGGPGVNYVESIGRNSFHSASQTNLAHELEVDQIYGDVAEQFHTIRLVLNDLKKRFMFLAGARSDRYTLPGDSRLAS